MNELIEEQRGKLALTNILSAVWLGEWDRYEEIFEQLPEDMQEEFPFHVYYDREKITLWYDNHFLIPGNYFVSPYASSYGTGKKDDETRRHDLLCLVGIYEKTEFYYPLETDRYPDHFGCLTAFIGAALQSKINALQANERENYEQLLSLEEEVRNKYIVPSLEQLLAEGDKKITHRFFKEFLQFYKKTMGEQWIEISEA